MENSVTETTDSVTTHDSETSLDSETGTANSATGTADEATETADSETKRTDSETVPGFGNQIQELDVISCWTWVLCFQIALDNWSLDSRPFHCNPDVLNELPIRILV